MFWSSKQGRYSKCLDKNIKALSDGDRSRIPWIFYVFSEQHKQSKLAAAKALNDNLWSLKFEDIIRIDEQMRQTTSMEWSIDWHKLKIESFFTSSMSADERRAVIIFGSFNPNGFIREQAVRMMMEYDGTLPYILLRQNDWVMQVRQAAIKAFEKRLSYPSVGEILSALPYVEKLKWSSRGFHGQYTQKFFNKIISPEHREDLLKGLKSDNIRTRKICVHVLLDATPTDIGQALIQLKCEPEPFLRKIIFEKLRHLGQDLTEPSHILLQDKYPANRLSALKYLRDLHQINILDIATQCLLDRNAMVRELARKIVHENMPDFAFRTFYIEHIEQNTVAAILGIGETGEKSDTDKVRKYLYDFRIAVARAAMLSVMKLDKDNFKDEIIEKLDNPSVGIVKTAQQLTTRYGTADYARIHEIFQQSLFEHTKVKCISILFSASKWNCLVYMLEALSCTMENVQKLAMANIQRWLFGFNKSFTQVSVQQKDNIHTLIDNQKGNIPASIERELLFILK